MIRKEINSRKFQGPVSRTDRRRPARQGNAGGPSRVTASHFGARTHGIRPSLGEIHVQEKRVPSPVMHDNLRLVPLGGLEEVGRNMSFLEYQDEIVIIDMGIQFPEEETPGVDFIIPNITYLEPKKRNIRGVVLTHAHLDHIGAVPYLIGKLGNPVIYTTALTKALIEKRQEEFPNAPKLRVEVVKYGDKVKIGKHLDLEFFGVAHTIPDTMGVVVKTPVGNIVHFADFRIDYDSKGNPQGLEDYERIGKMGIHTFMVDSTNAEEPGRSVSEKIVEKNLEDLFRKAKGRIIVGIFSSLLTRIDEIIKIADRLGRVVTISGRSMKDNVQIAQNLGYIKPRKGQIVPMEEVHKYRDDKILILSTGAQGESNASLMKIVNGEHRNITVKPGDMVIFSSSVIPGNERSVQVLKDNLSRQGAEVHTSRIVDLHASGHAPQEDILTVIKLLKPKYVIPIHGYYFMRSANAVTAREAGVSKENVIMLDNGQVLEISKDRVRVTNEQIPAFYVMVDGLGVGDVGEVVLRDRITLAQEGMIVIITTIDRNTGRVLKNPDIISRGFIYLKENQEILEEIRQKIRSIISRIPGPREIDSDYLKGLIRDQIGQFLYNKTRRRPMILPVIIEI